MLSLLITIPLIGVDYKFEGDTMVPEITERGSGVINASHIRMIEDMDDGKWRRIDLGGECRAYTSLSFVEIVELVESERRKLA